MSKEWWTILVAGQQPNERDRSAQQARELQKLRANLIRDERRIPFDDERIYTFRNIQGGAERDREKGEQNVSIHATLPGICARSSAG